MKDTSSAPVRSASGCHSNRSCPTVVSSNSFADGGIATSQHMERFEDAHADADEEAHRHGQSVQPSKDQRLGRMHANSQPAGFSAFPQRCYPGGRVLNFVLAF
jgi:hypothetical protein